MPVQYLIHLHAFASPQEAGFALVGGTFVLHEGGETTGTALVLAQDNSWKAHLTIEQNSWSATATEVLVTVHVTTLQGVHPFPPSTLIAVPIGSWTQSIVNENIWATAVSLPDGQVPEPPV